MSPVGDWQRPAVFHVRKRLANLKHDAAVIQIRGGGGGGGGASAAVYSGGESGGGSAGASSCCGGRSKQQQQQQHLSLSKLPSCATRKAIVRSFRKAAERYVGIDSPVFEPPVQPAAAAADNSNKPWYVRAKDKALCLRRLWKRKELPRIVMLGLDAAGKTSILYGLRLGEVVATIPTIGCVAAAAERLHRHYVVIVSFVRCRMRPCT